MKKPSLQKCVHTYTHFYVCFLCLLVFENLEEAAPWDSFSGKGFFAGSTEGTQSWLSAFLWINNPELCGIKDNNSFLDLLYPSPAPASSPSWWRQGSIVKWRIRCTVTIKHYTPRVEATVVKQVLISHPFPILLSCLELLHMLWIYSHFTYTPMQMFKHVQIQIQNYIWNGIWFNFNGMFYETTGHLLNNYTDP